VDRRFGSEIAGGVHAIGAPRHGMSKGGFSRAYLLEDGDDLTLIDTGWDDDGYMITRYLASIGRSPSEIAHIALTHAHRSHLGGLATLAALSDAEVSCHATEAPIVERREKARPIRLWPLLPLRLYVFRVISWLPILEHQACRVDRHLDDGSKVGKLTIAIHTPGHTPGHVAFRYRDSVLLVGDAVATWPRRLSAGWPGFNLDEGEYRRSLRKLVELRPQVVCPGHGDPLVDDVPRRLAKLVTPSATG
jgi:glyoxylase-like metal-dependent hydrolase (beta-lactamase superfamily II)